MKTKQNWASGLLVVWVGWMATAGIAQQIGTSISEDGALPNASAMLDIQSPSSGDGKGLLIPRITQAQRTTSDASFAGGLLNDSGQLRGGPSHGLMVYQTDGDQGVYYNYSGSASPLWVRLGNFHSDGSVAMTGPLNQSGNRITNLYNLDIAQYNVQIGEGAQSYSSSSGSVAIGRGAVARYGIGGVAIGCGANADSNGTAFGQHADGRNANIAVGFRANSGGGKDRITIGRGITNDVDNSARIRGTMYLDGGTGLLYRATKGSGGWIAKAFTIDHPEDPENKILRHFCVESPEVFNVYEGRAQLVDGEAEIELPSYYDDLNRTGAEIYSLAPIGTSASLYIKEEVSHNRFRVAGDRDVLLSWTIHVPRNDPACLADLANRPAEQLKGE